MHAARGKAALRGGLSQLCAILEKEAEGQRDREVLGEVEGERQEQWGGQERDRRVKTQKDSEKKEMEARGDQQKPTQKGHFDSLFL